MRRVRQSSFGDALSFPIILKGASANQAREFAVRGAPSGNQWQLTGAAQNDLSSPIDQEYPLLQTQGVIQLRELPIKRPQWQMPDLSCDLQHQAV